MSKEEKGEAKKDRAVTSLKIDNELWREVKIEAIKQGENLYELVERAVRKELVALRGKEWEDEGEGEEGEGRDYYSEGLRGLRGFKKSERGVVKENKGEN
ncbi:MAG: hypothetical protein WA977_10005 [Halobacteriota archaeon]